MEYRSALLASRGYVSLSLGYSDKMDVGEKPRHVGIDYSEVFRLLYYNIWVVKLCIYNLYHL